MTLKALPNLQRLKTMLTKFVTFVKFLHQTHVHCICNGTLKLSGEKEFVQTLLLLRSAIVQELQSQCRTEIVGNLVKFGK